MTRAGARNEVRIIGGRLRGRKVRFPSVPGLRPTLDRQRGTVFNWLSLDIDGARCADLAAGSGVFGFEAMSRGAGEVVLIDRDPAVTQALRQSADALGIGCTVLRRDLLEWLNRPAEFTALDIVFLDPPYAWARLDEALRSLAHGAALRPGGLLVVESSRNAELPAREEFEILRTSNAGESRIELLRRPIPGG